MKHDIPSLVITTVGVAQWVARLTRSVEVVGSSPFNDPVVSLSKKLYPYWLVLVGSRNGFERDFTYKAPDTASMKEVQVKVS